MSPQPKPPSKQPLQSEPLLKFEREALSLGFKSVAGVDEAGRGPLAGPVVAAACIIPIGIFLEGINDSKLLSPAQRCHFFETLTSNPEIHWGVGVVSHTIIDRINILEATKRAMKKAVAALSQDPDYLLVDGLFLTYRRLPGLKIIKGDRRSQSIAAASIIAKEWRDRLMQKMHQKYPKYGFDRHKGYGTAAHKKALLEHGPCPIHRRTFEPVKGSLI